jgi:hypothetical protein
MLPAVIGDLEQGIGHQLLRPLAVREQPFAAGEEGRLDVIFAQVIDDAALIARDLVAGLAEVEGQRDELLAGRKLHAADDAARHLRDRRKFRRHALGRSDERGGDAPLNPLVARVVGERRRRPAWRGRSHG